MASLGEARRTVAEGGAYLNNERLTEADAPVPAEALLHGRWLVLRRGKRTVAGVELGLLRGTGPIWRRAGECVQ